MVSSVASIPLSAPLVQHATSPGGGATRDLLLIVEDNEDDYFVSARQLQKAGVTGSHHHCVDGQEARDYLSGAGAYADRARHPLPRLILADIKMPRLNGLELLRWVRAQPLLRRIPVVMLTSSDAPSDVAAAYDAFASGYLVKSGRTDEMVDAFRTLRHFWYGVSQPPPLA